MTALCHNYRHFAMVAEARELIRSGAIGEGFLVHGVFLQDWLSLAGVRNWRLDPDVSGPSTTFADIGTHWCDLAMHLTGCPIELSVRGHREPPRAADRRPRRRAAALRGRRARDARLVSGLAGCQNSLRIRLDGSEGSLYWDQEKPEELWRAARARRLSLADKSAAELHGWLSTGRTCRLASSRAGTRRS